MVCAVPEFVNPASYTDYAFCVPSAKRNVSPSLGNMYLCVHFENASTWRLHSPFIRRSELWIGNAGQQGIQTSEEQHARSRMYSATKRHASFSNVTHLLFNIESLRFKLQGEPQQHHTEHTTKI